MCVCYKKTPKTAIEYRILNLTLDIQNDPILVHNNCEDLSSISRLYVLL
jgi:hypothetical protein